MTYGKTFHCLLIINTHHEVLEGSAVNTQAGEAGVENAAGFLERSRWAQGRGKSWANIRRDGESCKGSKVIHKCGPKGLSELTSTAQDGWSSGGKWYQSSMHYWRVQDLCLKLNRRGQTVGRTRPLGKSLRPQPTWWLTSESRVPAMFCVQTPNRRDLKTKWFEAVQYYTHDLTFSCSGPTYSHSEPQLTVRNMIPLTKVHETRGENYESKIKVLLFLDL